MRALPLVLLAGLVCSAFAGDAPDSHAMVCQTGRIGVRRGQWYRLTFLARAEGIARGAVDVGLVDMASSRNADLAAEASRLQFWFRGTGTLWLDEVVIEETEDGEERFPALPADAPGNLLPNASFECGKAGWGGYSFGLPGWSGGLWRLEGELDHDVTFHGGTSLRIPLRAGAEPVFSFDCYEPVRVPARRLFAANLGWFRAKPGETFTLSAHLLAQEEGTPATLLAVEPDGRRSPKTVTVGTNWARHQLTFSPRGNAFFVGVGIDLPESPGTSGTLWVDGVQLERGGDATPFAPRRPLEAFLSPVVPDGITTDGDGLDLRLTAFNDGDAGTGLEGTLVLTDFRDRPLLRHSFALPVASHTGAVEDFPNLLPGRTGFFRARIVGDPEAALIRESRGE